MEQSAWYTGRSIDISYILEEAENFGKPIKGDNLKRFLAEFGNNEIEFTTPGNTFSNIRVNIDAMFDFTLTELNKIGSALNDEVIPVGYVHYDAGILLMGEMSGFYMINNDDLYKIGNDFIEALETIVFEKDLIRLTSK